MIKKISLGGRSSRQLYDEAQKLIPSYSGSWTNWNLSDPGVTILQSLALLSEELDNEAETATERDIEKLLELFGNSANFARPAGLTLFLSMPSRELLPGGTPFLLRGVQFELEEEVEVQAGAITGIWHVQGEKTRDVSSLIYAKSPLKLFEESEAGPVSIYITLSSGAKRGEKLRIYVEAASAFPRNKADIGLPFAEISWEVLAGGGFVACEARDKTHCFTQNGFVEIKIPERMARRNGGYQLRAMVLRHDYDIAPRINRIWGGHVELLQKRTLSRCLSFDSHLSESLTFPLPYWGIETADLLVLGRDESGGFRRYYMDEDKPRSCSLLRKNGVYSLYICCEKMPCTDRDSVRVLIRRPETLSMLELGSVIGYDGQRFVPKWRGAYPAEGAKLILMQKSGGETVYEDVDASCCNVFCSISPSGEVTAKRAATDGDNLLFFSQLALTLGEKGNFYQESLAERGLAGCRGKNPGGIAESLASLTAELEAPRIAVTTADYERLALETPGLSLEAAAAQKNNNGIMQIAVKPYSDKPCPKLGALQSEAITRYLNERRILNTKIEIISPRWIAVEIETDVSAYPQAVSPERQIADAIRSGVKWGGFGATVSYGRIHSLMDTLDCVESVSRLEIRIGGIASDNIKQDFAAIFYLENLHINCETRL